MALRLREPFFMQKYLFNFVGYMLLNDVVLGRGRAWY